ncbi:D-alanyl-D-alanine dipeptidase [Capnocytophaga canis]|uniref:D-alanyl-D-alanine dipeptidase n=1 Tax=Capnocytophaga canis TaxID=1848903 RepID=A0A0B7IJY7_9FLAO|nr:M15 family metallopeptidase [Capnocytophaga canis]CEN50283.1 D-alanyl-D-alanine dipeptidase [Capnocytophaga canis]
MKHSKQKITVLLQLFFIGFGLVSCKNNQHPEKNTIVFEQKVLSAPEEVAKTEGIEDNRFDIVEVKTTPEGVTAEKDSLEIEKQAIYDDFINIKSLSGDFVLDIKYATEDNFLGQAVYDCPECFLRRATAQALHNANEEFKTLGYRIKIFDCYRPLSVQKKMWNILPGTNYVANPAKGSKHNRGAAVDLTLVDSEGNELDMGTPFDFFGKEAHHTYTKLPKEVLQNRNLLKTTLNKHNFKSIYSEWWHYEYRPEMESKVEDFVWECN